MFGKKNDSIREYRDARNELDQIAREDRRNGVHDETDRYYAANDRVAQAAKNVPWYRR